MDTPRQIKPVDLDEILQKAAEEVGENIRKNHFRRLRGRHAEVVDDDAGDIRKLLAVLDKEEDDEEEEE